MPVVDNVKKEQIKSIWFEQLDSIFEETEKTEMTTFLSILSMIVFDKFDDNVAQLYSIVNDMEKFSKIINKFSGMTIQFPDRNEFKDSLIVALSYYYKELKHMDWKDIQKIINTNERVAMKAGKGIVKLNKLVKNNLNELLQKEDE